MLRSAEALAVNSLVTQAAALLADAAEKEGKALEAAREYQRAAELEPTEPHLFDWGTELLVHRAADQAVEVFTRGNHLFPHSTRMLLGLAVAYVFARFLRSGRTSGSSKRHTELESHDPAPYLFLGKLTSAGITESSGYAERLRRFATLQPENCLGELSITQPVSGSAKPRRHPRFRRWLEKAVRLDTHLGVAFLQPSGWSHAEQGKDAHVISAYRNARSMPVHLWKKRIIVWRRRTGRSAKRRRRKVGLPLRESKKRSAQELERERAEIQQFVFELRKP